MSIANPVIGSWDGPNRRIYLLQGVDAFHWMDDIYIEYRKARRLETDDLRKYNAFMIASGNEPKGLGKATPRLVKLLEGVKVIFWDEPGEKYVTGEAITDDADNDPTLFDNSTRTTAIVINYEPPAAEVIVVDAIVKSLDYKGVLTYDEVNGYPGQEHPVGTSAMPSNNMADGIVIAATYALSKVETKSDVHMTLNTSKFTVTGLTPDLVFYPQGFKADLCKLDGLVLDGDFNGSHLHVYDCDITEALNVHGKIKDSFHGGRILITANQNLNMTDCESSIPGINSPEIDMNQGQDTTFSGRNISGGLIVNYCDTVNCVTTISFADGGKPHLEPTNTAGYISVRGLAFLDDRSNGTTIDTTALHDPSAPIPEADKQAISDKVWIKVLP